MKRLIQFVFRNIHWLLFCIFIYLSVLLIVNNNQFQRSKYLQAMRETTGSVRAATSGISSYLHLKSVNAELAEQLAQLTAEVQDYRLRSGGVPDGGAAGAAVDSLLYSFIPAKVINNSVALRENYITLNKGALDGIRADMGVLSPSGVVGVVVNTSPHFSTVISLLNTKYRLNGKIRQNDYYGPLMWDGKDPQFSFLTEIPRYADYQIGDTIVTSGYSTVFPQGIPVGAIVEVRKQRDDNYRSLRIRLFTNFSNLSEVMVVANRLQKEQKELEEQTMEPQIIY